MVRKVPERVPLPATSDPALRAALLDVLQQDGYAINQLLGAFETGTWTPTFTFATPGDLSVAYTAQEGQYQRIGARLFFSTRIVLTPTFGGTASGAARFSLPAAVAADVTTTMFPVRLSAASVTWPTGLTSVVAFARESEDWWEIAFQGDSAVGQNMVAADMTSGASVGFFVSGHYQVDFEHP